MGLIRVNDFGGQPTASKLFEALVNGRSREPLAWQPRYILSSSRVNLNYFIVSTGLHL
jgi:hypothetical protein